MAALGERSEPYIGPVVQLGRFVDGQLELFKARTSDTTFIAISHVWGRIEWRTIDTLGIKVLASKQKAHFIKNKMARLIGSMPFWMDTITVNQEDPLEVIAAVQSIPAIFRDACKTLVLREREGLESCCSQAVEGFSDWPDLRRRLADHARSHSNFDYADTYLQRLWTFQEILLSHTIEFVPYGLCHSRGNRQQALNPGRSMSTALSYLDTLYTLGRSFVFHTEVADDVQKIAEFIRSYISYAPVQRKKPPLRAADEDIYKGSFHTLHMSSACQATKPRDYIFATMPQFPWYCYPSSAITMTFGEIFFDLYQQATKAGRPFFPRITRSMTEATVAPAEAWLPSVELPEPQYLGDFLKLLGQPERGVSWPHFTTTMHVRGLVDECATDIMDLIAESMEFSGSYWQLSEIGQEVSKFGGYPETGLTFTSERNIFMRVFSKDNKQEELSSDKEGSDGEEMAKKGGSIADNTDNEEEASNGDKSEAPPDVSDAESNDWLDDESSTSSTHADLPFERMQQFEDESTRMTQRPDEWILVEARKVLTMLWRAYHSHFMKDSAIDLVMKLKGDATPRLLNTLLLLSAMIGCQVPLSAAAWVRQHFVPVKIHYSSFHVLGLLARHAIRAETLGDGVMMATYGRQLSSGSLGLDLTINDPETKLAVGLIPDFHHPPQQYGDVKPQLSALYAQSGKDGGFKVVIL